MKKPFVLPTKLDPHQEILKTAPKLDPVQEQLLQLRGITRLTGMVHEAQANQLKYWPMISINHASSSEVSFEIDEEGKRTVFVELVATKEAPADLKERGKALIKNIQWLLGNDWAVSIRINGKSVCRGVRKPEPAPKASGESDAK